MKDSISSVAYLKDKKRVFKDLAKKKELNHKDAGEYDEYFEEDQDLKEFVKYCMPNT